MRSTLLAALLLTACVPEDPALEPDAGADVELAEPTPYVTRSACYRYAVAECVRQNACGQVTSCNLRNCIDVQDAYCRFSSWISDAKALSCLTTVTLNAGTCVPRPATCTL